jgi:hypothetical protein
MAKRKKLTHLPKLPPDRLKLLEIAIDKSTLSKAGKRAVKASLKAAQNENAESPDVIIASLPKERRATVVQHTAEFIEFSQGITTRGKDKLTAMSDETWEVLLNDGSGGSSE